MTVESRRTVAVSRHGGMIRELVNGRKRPGSVEPAVDPTGPVAGEPKIARDGPFIRRAGWMRESGREGSSRTPRSIEAEPAVLVRLKDDAGTSFRKGGGRGPRRPPS